MKLMGISLSPFVRKAAVVLTIKGIDYEQEQIMPGNSEPEFRALSPLGKIPVLIDGDLTLADSSVICEYLDEKYPEPSVMPKEPENRARARFLEEYADSKFIEVAAIFFIENFVAPNMMGKEPDTARIAEAENELLPPHLDYLEAQVPPEGYLFGNFTTADIAVASPLFNAAYGGYSVDATRWPRMAAFVQRVAEHPAVAKVKEVEMQFLAQMQSGS
jgi:glutathione S-transferase